MWKCKACKEENENSFDMCWSCGTDKKGSLNKDFDTSESAQESVYKKDSLNKDFDTNESVQASVYNKEGVLESQKNYEAAGVIANLVVAIGWIALAVGVVTAFIVILDNSRNVNQLLAVLPSLVISMSGLFFVLAGQVTLAIVDNTNNTKEILEIMKNKSN